MCSIYLIWNGILQFITVFYFSAVSNILDVVVAVLALSWRSSS